MDGKIFLYSEINPSKLSQFVFDLQRFAGDATAETAIASITRNGTTEYYSSLKVAVTNAQAGDTNYLVEGTNYQVLGDNIRVGASMTIVTPYVLYIDGNENYYETETAFVAAKAAASNVASIGDNKYFTSLNRALNFAESGDTIKLLQNTTETVTIANDVTLDLNGKTLTGSSNYAISVASGKLTIIDSGTGGKVTATDSAVKVTGGTLNLKGGTLTATANSANIVELADTSTTETETNASFTMSGGNIQSSATASGSNVPAGVSVGRNRFFSMLGGRINTAGLGIASKGQNVQIKGGSIKGKTGIRMLAGALNVLGGKIRGLANAAGGSNVVEDSDGFVIPLATVDGEFTGGDGIEIASSDAAVTVNVGQSGQNADIDIGGSTSALNIGGNNTGDTINLYASKLSSVTNDSDTAGTGSSINYQNNSAKLTLDGVILDSKVETTGTEPPANVTVTSVAMSSDAKSGTTNTAFTNGLTENASSLDGNTYNTKGDVITKNQVATINGKNYSSLNKAIGAAEANSEITLSKSQSISERIEVSKALTIKFGSNTLTYNGEGNAALKVTSGEVTIDKAEAFKDSKGKVLGIAIAKEAKVYVPTPSNSNVAETDDGVVEPANSPEGYSDFKTIAKAKIIKNNGEEVYFMTLEQAVELLNTGDTAVATSLATSDGSLTVTTSEGNTTLFALGGLSSGSSVSFTTDPNVVSLTGANFGNGGVTVNSNDDGYKFNLSGTTPDTNGNAKFTGAAMADTIENAIASLTIDGGAGADQITNSGAGASISGGDNADTINNTGDSVTIDAGAGNDEIFSTGDNVSIVGGYGNDILHYMGGKVTFKFDRNDTVNLGTLAPVTDGSLLTTTEDDFVLKFSDNNILTLQGTDSIAVTSSIASEQQVTYAYTSTTISLQSNDSNGVTLGANATTFDANTNSTASINAAAVTNGVKITDADDTINNFVTLGSSKDIYVYKGGSDRIEGYTYDNAAGSGFVSLGGTASIAPISFGNSLSYDGTNYVVNLETNNSLTFAGTNTFALKTSEADSESIYTYTPGTIALDGGVDSIQGVTLGGAYYSATSFNGTLEANSKFVSINAAAVNHTLKVTGNEKDNYMVASDGFKTTLLGNEGKDYLQAGASGAFLNGGDDDDTLVGGAGNDTFAYTGGADSISGYGAGQDIISVASGINIAGASIATADTNNLVLGFDSGDSLTFAGLAANDNAKTVSLQSGRNTYRLTKDSFALNDSITLTSAFSATSFEGGDAYNTINASAVTGAISITGNDNGNYIVGSATMANSLSGGTGNDTFKGGSGNDVFFYAGGRDVIEGFGTTDSLSITGIDKITKAKASSSKLVFMKDKDNTITFKATDEVEAPTIVSVESGGYLTKDGYVSGNGFSLFGSAKGKIDLADDLYKDANITSVDASAVKKQGVTLVGGTSNGTFTFAEKNKKRDAFEYGGDGSVTISGYESGRDRINLGAASISGFEITNTNDVLISLDSDANKTVSLKSAKGSEVLIHQSTSKGNTYSKMVFNDSGIIYDKSSVSATSATLWSNANDGYTASGKIKKVTAVGFTAAHSITANNSVNTFIDASGAGSAGVSLIGGAKNDKFTGSDGADMFVYTGGGKDVIQNFGAGDQISLATDFKPLEANITSNRNFIKFKFDNKNMLTIKPTKGDTLNGSLNVNGENRTYYKDAIVTSSGTASLTSKFGGTFKVKDYTGVTTVNGSLSKNKLTIKGTTGAETLMGGTSKTTFKGGGGADSLVGGSGADTFFYAKGDKDTVTIADFDFTKDNLKIANGTIKQISVVDSKVQFAMKTGKTINDPTVGNFKLDSYAKYKKENGEMVKDSNFTAPNTSQVLIKANNTYYWFANDAGTDVKGDPFAANALITSDKKISSSKASGYQVIELNYSTNLVKAGVAVAVKDANLPSKSQT